MKTVRLLLATALTLCVAVALAQNHPPAHQFQEAIHLMETKGDYTAALRHFEEVSKDPDRTLAARALLYIGLCYEKLGSKEAQKAYQRLVRDFPEQREVVKEARARLSALAQPLLPDASGAVARRIWEGPEMISVGSLSSDGRFLSYVENDGDLAVRDLVTGESRQLTNSGSLNWDDYAEDSKISPRGKDVAYAWRRKDLFWELRVISMNGGEPLVLYGGEGTNYVDPAGWTVDGKQILTTITQGDQTNQIAFVSVADGSLRVIKTVDWRYPRNASLSPDGRYVAYDFPATIDSPNRDIFLLAADGSYETRLIDHPADDLSPLWVPDGKSVLFTSDRTGSFGMWAIRVAEGKAQGPPELIKADWTRSQAMGFSRRGSLYYSESTSLSDVYVATLDPTGMHFLVPPEPLLKQLTGSSAVPEWSPDGEYLAYVSRLGLVSGETSITSTVLAVRSMKTGEERELILKIRMSRYDHLRWSRDGRVILVGLAADERGRVGHYLVDPQSGETTLLLDRKPGEDIGQVDWSGDGKAIFFNRAAVLLKLDLQTGSAREILPSSGSFAVSPEGERLALISTVKDGEKSVHILKVISAGGGDGKELLTVEPPGFIRAPAWTPDGRKILLVKSSFSGSNPPSELWRIAAEGGEIERLELPRGDIRGLRIHPDGKRIAFDSHRRRGEIWVIDNFMSMLNAVWRTAPGLRAN